MSVAAGCSANFIHATLVSIPEQHSIDILRSHASLRQLLNDSPPWSVVIDDIQHELVNPRGITTSVLQETS